MFDNYLIYGVEHFEHPKNLTVKVFLIFTEYELGKEEALSISDNYLKSYETEKEKRATFQYETTESIKLTKAQTSLNRAKEFLILIESLLQNMI